MRYVVVIWRDGHWEEYFSSNKLKEARQWAEESMLLGCGSSNIRILNAKLETLKLRRFV